ncbi:twin-arginine translocase TatA/TatE family subunit [Microbacterium betulae]|uniref:Twin-arginine translocase TatA/TatE family subunit n=1 Tax=Microbacterium betulae TaxID=2981139 RepID=A0AA97I705_9MICO|nr:twin-arginine translocase TatA/TatE family subunit [Microbacterium sp. AB]WOF22920.1 twin-arginine translocase TatA/TatE family subunit [Microbacterium sp. AB]
MFGLTFEKLLVIAAIAAVVIGPQRLPRYAERLGELIRAFRAFLDAARERTAAETGLSAEDWKALDPRRYDPRRIVREALEPVPAASEAPGDVPRIAVSAAGPDVAHERPDPEGVVLGGEMRPGPAPVPVATPSPVAAGGEGSVLEGPVREGVDGAVAGDEPAPARRMKWVVVGGSSGHPRRMLVEVDEDDRAGAAAPDDAAERDGAVSPSRAANRPGIAA